MAVCGLSRPYVLCGRCYFLLGDRYQDSDLQCFVFDFSMLFHTQVDHRECANKSCKEKYPSREEHIHVASNTNVNITIQSINGFKTYGSFTASARQIPAAPADCMDL